MENPMNKGFMSEIAIILAASLQLFGTIFGGLLLPALPLVHVPNILSSFGEAYAVSLGMVLAMCVTGYGFLTIPAFQKVVGGTALFDKPGQRVLSIVSILGGVLTASTVHPVGVVVDGLGGALLVTLLLFVLHKVTVYALTRQVR